MRQLFEKTYDVIAFPILGYDYIYSPTSINIENQMRDIEGMIIQHGLTDKKTEMHIVGHGWGSVIA